MRRGARDIFRDGSLAIRANSAANLFPHHVLVGQLQQQIATLQKKAVMLCILHMSCK